MKPRAESYFWLVLFVILCMGTYFYWLAFPLLNTKATDKYTRPQNFKSVRGRCEWILIMMLSIPNLFIYFLLVLMVTNNHIRGYKRIHKIFSFLIMISNGIVAASLVLRWFFVCNTSYSPQSTMCNDVRWCCAFFHTSDGWCRNDVPCIPDISSTQLNMSNEYRNHIGMALAFTVLAAFNYLYGNELQREGILKK